MSKEEGKLLLLEAKKRKYKKWFVISIAFVMVSLGLFRFSSQDSELQNLEDLSVFLGYVGFLGAGILYLKVLAIQREIKAELKVVVNRRLRQNRIKRYRDEARRDEKVFNYRSAIKFYEALGEKGEVERVKKLLAHRREKALDYDAAINIYEELGEIEEAARVRKLKAEQGAVKVSQNVQGDQISAQNVVYGDQITAQKVVQGDEITRTDIRDSVVSRSNVGAGSSKMQELKELTEMKEKGTIDDTEFQQMKKEILGK